MTMSKQRWLRPSDFRHVPLLEQTAAVRLTFHGLLLFADDEGRALADARLLKADLYPLDEDVTVETLIEQLLLLEEIGVLSLYRSGGRQYLQLDSSRLPRADSPKPSEHPPPPPETVRTSSGSSPDPIAVEGEGRAEESAERSEGEGTPGLHPDEPSPFCSQHPDGTEKPCGGCGTARTRHELFMRRQRGATS